MEDEKQREPHHFSETLQISAVIFERFAFRIGRYGIIQGRLKSFEYYLASANGDLAGAASAMAEDFHEMWWNSPAYEASRERNKAKVRDKTSALRIEISNYLNSISLSDLMASEYRKEIELLSKLNVDGIITTNWDLLLEKLFPDLSGILCAGVAVRS